jgi:hypothetical protein
MRLGLGVTPIRQNPACRHGVDEEDESGFGPTQRSDGPTAGRISYAMPSRLFAIGDIHGCNVALKTLIEAIDPQSDDTIVILGDVIDYGPDSKGVIQQLIDLFERCQLVLLKLYFPQFASLHAARLSNRSAVA